MKTLRSVLVLGLLLMLPVAMLPAASAQEVPDEPEGVQTVPKELPSQAVIDGREAPKEPNPYLSQLPAGVEPDWAYWRALARARSEDQPDDALRARAVPAVVPVDEEEPPGEAGLNDTPETAQFIPGLGTGEGEDLEAAVSGTLRAAPAATPIGPFAEDDGAIPLASPTGLSAETTTVETNGTIGDGPYGSAGTATGDFDFFSVTVTEAGADLTVDVDTPDPGGSVDLDPVVGVYDSTGTLIAFNDDDGESFDSLLTLSFEAPGDYFVYVGGFGSFALNDPFDPASGPGAGSEGTYEVVFSQGADIDFYSFDLRPGDIVGATVSGGPGRIVLIDPEGKEVIGSSQDATFIAPEETELPGGGNAVLAHVADLPGRYAIGIETGTGEYDALFRLRRPPLEREPDAATQTLFLDFDGEEINTGIFGGPGVRTLSPLSAFLPGWGLGPEDEDAVIDAIVASVAESLSEDLRVKGSNGDRDATGEPGDFDVEILNSRDHPDPFAEDNVSRVIVGGTIEESGIPTIGIAQTIDVGNFDQTESALTLLDLLSAPADDPNSLNQFVGPETDIVALVGTGVGNITAHEAGHFFGNFHTEQFETPPNIQDQGGNLANIVGVGPDGIFGTEDDIDVDFGEDLFVPSEGFTGIEDTLNTIAFGLSTGLAPEAAAPGAPTDVTAVAGRRSAFVSWTPPADDGGAAITGYVVRATQPGSTVVLSEAFPADATTVVFDGLRPRRTYVFTVAAVNEAGEGPQSEPSAPVTTRPPFGGGGVVE